MRFRSEPDDGTPKPPDVAATLGPSSEGGLERGLLSYFCSLTVLITLAPFRFHSPSIANFIWFGGWFDIVCNVLLFLPLGFLYRLTGPATSSFRVLRLGLLVSAGIELMQLFMPGRYASPADVFTNGAGAWLGALLCDRAQHLLSRRWVGRLALEVPLMNIVYLLVPLIWLNSLAAGSDQSRSRLSWLLGLCGSIVLAGLYQHGRKAAFAFHRAVLALVAGVWFLCSSAPAFLEAPSTPLYGSALIALSMPFLVALPLSGPSDQRRFEIPVLKRVWPVYVIYLLLLSLWPVPSGYTAWRAAWGLVELAEDPGLIPILRLMERFAAFTLLGYMVAESHGRRDVSRAQSIAWSCSWCAVASALLETGRGLHPEHVASLVHMGLSFLGSVYGAVIYWLQLASIQRLISRSTQTNLASRV